MIAVADRRRVFVVVDANGEEWGRYLYPGMAEQVAERCNADRAPVVSSRAPYRVTEEFQ